jgi:DsbC/DsbD-like thiol-disulfide interchange protein
MYCRAVISWWKVSRSIRICKRTATTKVRDACWPNSSAAPSGPLCVNLAALFASLPRSHDYVSGVREPLTLDNHMSSCRLKLLNSVLVCVAGLSPAFSPAWAQDSSAWQSEAHAAARLIAGAVVKKPSTSFIRAGIEIRLDPGWKTYWRYPGDTGVPPTFDFAGSQNVKSTNVQWPAPERFSDGAGGHSIGYLGDIILPVEVTPADASRPAALHVKLGYAICGTLCVPGEATLELALTGNSADETMLEKAERHVPKRIALGPGSGLPLAILSVHREAGDGGHDRVAVDIAAPADAPVELYAEGPTPEWALPLPEPAGPATGPTRRFTFDLDGLPPGAEPKGAKLTLTAVSGNFAIEVPAHLD